MASPSRAIAEPAPSWQPEKIPPFPAVALKALKLIAGTDSSLIELCNLIRVDAGFSSEILRIANSPLIAFPKTITNILQASMLLGFQRLRKIVLTVGLHEYLHGNFTPVLQSCWRHSLATALIAERAATWCGLDKEFAHTAGVLHDIGRIALAVSMPKLYDKVVEKGAELPLEVLQIERELCGLDHCEAGRTLVTNWGLPEAFLSTTACHHNSSAAMHGSASLLPPSCLLADMLGFSVTKYRSSRSYADALAGFSQAMRGRFPADAKQLHSEIANEIKLLETP